MPFIADKSLLMFVLWLSVASKTPFAVYLFSVPPGTATVASQIAAATSAAAKSMLEVSMPMP